ncbi:hypothetical protein D3C80_2225410 [compost metagenome]
MFSSSTFCLSQTLTNGRYINTDKAIAITCKITALKSPFVAKNPDIGAGTVHGIANPAGLLTKLNAIAA